MDILIIEKEISAIERLTKLLQELNQSSEILVHIDNIEDVIKWFEKQANPDLIFMALQLKDGNAFQIFKHLFIPSPIVFTIFNNPYTTRTFSNNHIPYLLKPIKKMELQSILNNIKVAPNPPTLDYKTLAQELTRDEYNKRFLIRLGQQITIIEMRDCAYFYSKNRVTFLVTNEGKRYPIDYSLEKLESLADPHSFFRINRQFIIHIEAIQEMFTCSKSRVQIHLSPAFELSPIVSTDRSPHFKRWLVGEE